MTTKQYQISATFREYGEDIGSVTIDLDPDTPAFAGFETFIVRFLPPGEESPWFEAKLKNPLSKWGFWALLHQALDQFIKEIDGLEKN